MSELVTEVILEGGLCDGQTWKVCEGVASVLTVSLMVPECPAASMPPWRRVLEYRRTGQIRDGKPVFRLHRFHTLDPYCGVL